MAHQRGEWIYCNDWKMFCFYRTPIELKWRILHLYHYHITFCIETSFFYWFSHLLPLRKFFSFDRCAHRCSPLIPITLYILSKFSESGSRLQYHQELPHRDHRLVLHMNVWFVNSFTYQTSYLLHHSVLETNEAFHYECVDLSRWE